MSKKILLPTFFSLLIFGALLYGFIEKQNRLTKVRIDLPALAKEIEEIEEENLFLRFELNQFQNPQNLLRLAATAPYRHLRHPEAQEVGKVDEGIALQLDEEDLMKEWAIRAKPTLASGVK